MSNTFVKKYTNMDNEPFFLGDWIPKTDPEILEEELAGQLLEAINLSDLQQIKILIEQGVNVNFQSDEYDLAIVAAVESGNLEIITALIRSGSDVNATSDSGMRVIDIAIRRNCLEMVKLLVESGADIHSIDEGRETALYRAAWEQKQEIYDYLYPLYLDNEYRQWLEKVRPIALPPRFTIENR
jgi:ankyrin repeat protein